MVPLAGRPSLPVVGAADWLCGVAGRGAHGFVSCCHEVSAFIYFTSVFWPLSGKAILGAGIFLEPAIWLTSLVLKLIILEFSSSKITPSASEGLPSNSTYQHSLL